jgi:NRPS condensation-like uncharacterized protein
VHTQGGEGPVGKWLAVVREIFPYQFNAIRITAKKYQASINEYLLAALFQTIKKWNQQQGGKSGRIYINVPVNLRSPGDHTVGNILSNFDISLRTALIGDKRKMLKLIRKEHISMMENDLARTYINLTWFLKPVPLKLKSFMFKHPRAFYLSIMLSNLGIFYPNHSHKDEEGFHYLGPARICSISVITAAIPWPQLIYLTYNNRISISLSVFRSHFSLEAAGRLLDSFIQEIME